MSKSRFSEIKLGDFSFGTDSGNMYAVGAVTFDEDGVGPEIVVRAEVDVELHFTLEQIQKLVVTKAIQLVREVAALPDETVEARIALGMRCYEDRLETPSD